MKVLIVFKTTKKEAVSPWLYDLSLLFFFFPLLKKEQLKSTFFFSPMISGAAVV